MCSHMARAARQGRKTVTWRPLPLRQQAESNPPLPFDVGEVLWVSELFYSIGDRNVAAADLVTDFFDDKNQPPIPHGYVFRGRTDESTAMLRVQVDSVEIIRLDLSHPSLADNGNLPIGNGSVVDEFIRQWDATYRGLHSTSALPLCSLVKFHVVA